jgi:hypothetical protein
MLKRNLAVLVLAAALVGGGAVAWAQTSDSSPSKPAPSTSPAAPNGQTREGVPKGRNARAAGILRRVVHGDLVVRGKDGNFENVTYDRGTLDGVSGDTLTLTRPDGKKVSVKLTSDTKFRGVANASELKAGKQTLVTSRDGKALTVAQRAGNKQGGPRQQQNS